MTGKTGASVPAPPAPPAFGTLLEMPGLLLFLCRPDGTVVWSNGPAAAAFARSRDTLAGVQFDDLVVPNDAVFARLDTGRTREVVASGTRARGVEVDLIVDWNVRVDRDRGLVYLAGRDVTEARRRDDEVRRSESQLRAILAHAPSGVYVKDLDGRILLANEEWRRLVPRNAQRSAAAVLSPLERHVAASGQPCHHDIRLDTSQGELDFLVTLAPLDDADGTVFAVCGIATDISDRKRVERSLSAREGVLETVLQASPDIISLMDEAGRIHQVSSAEELILGHRRDASIERDLFPLVHPDDFDDVASAFIRMVTGSVSRLHLRYRVRHADGHWVTVDSRGQAVVDAQHRFLGAVVVSRDITDHLEAEERLESIRASAVQASRAKSDFLSRMSHELRTPLNAILGFSQLLEMDDLPVPQADAVGHILRAGHHLLDLINEVLDIARIEAGRLELASVPVGLAGLLDDALDLTHPMSERADIALSVHLGDPSLAVLGDRQRLLQVLLNLMSNAVKYNRSGGRVDVSCRMSGDNRVRVAIADTGHGIRPENADRVFEPFDRLGVEQFGVEGTGIGLSLSKHLVEEMGGSLGFESVPDVGSTFVVELPAAVLPREEESRAAGRKEGGGAIGVRFQVLLIEQNLASQELVERVLARRPSTSVLAAMHGRLGIELARERRPDLILLDLQLPDMPGSAVLDRLAEDPATAGIPVAILSDERVDLQARRMTGRGVAGHVVRPVDARALLSLVDAVRATSAH